MAGANKRTSERPISTAVGSSKQKTVSTSSASSLCLSAGCSLDVVLDDKKILSDPIENKNRRTIVVKREENGSFGFTLQSYGLRRSHSNETDLLSYVDYVEIGGPAHQAGMREGDVILSINGNSMEKVDHEKLVDCIKSCEDSIRMVVLFEDVCRKIELHQRYFKLKQILESKKRELRSLIEQETKILQKVGTCGDNSTSASESTDASSILGGAYLSCQDSKLSELNSCSSGVFQSTSDLSKGDGSPWSPSLHLHSGGVFSPSPSIESPQVEAFHHTLSAFDDEFWSSNSGYGSLPTRSQKRAVGNACSRITSVKWRIGDRPFIGSALQEEGNESDDYLPTADNQAKGTNLSVPYPAASPKGILSTVNHVPQKLRDKKSSSVPNLIKLKIHNSPFVTRRLLSVPPCSKQRLMRNYEADLNVSIVHDPRNMTKQLRQEISNHVITEDLHRRSDDPQLLGLRQLCSDFRYGSIQEILKQHRKSIEFKTTSDESELHTWQKKKKTGLRLSQRFGSLRKKLNKKPTALDFDDLRRCEIESAARMRRSISVDVKGLDRQLSQENWSDDQSQHLPNCIFDSCQDTKESHVVNSEVTDDLRKLVTSEEKLTFKKVVSSSENSTELQFAGCDADQCSSTTDEVTRL